MNGFGYRLVHTSDESYAIAKLIWYLGQRKRNMYKDAGVMGEKIRSNISNNPMMTSPSFGSSIPSAAMFQPTFQPGSENGNTQPETQTQVR